MAAKKDKSIFETLAHLYGDEIINVSLKDKNNKFQNQPVAWKDAEKCLKYRDDFDVYLSFTPLKDPKGGRKLSNAGKSWVFAVDIDSAPVPSEFFPQIIWESSPNKLQGLYIMDHAIEPAKISSISKGLSAEFGYDPGSIDAVHLFRMPGSRNHKYPSSPEVGNIKWVADSIAPYRVRDLEKFAKKAGPTETIEFDYEEVKPKKDYNSLTKLPISEATDRSQWHYRIVASLKKEGATQGEILYLLNRVDGKKFEGQRLKDDIARVYARTIVKQEREEEPALFSIVPIKDVEDQQPEWLIEGLWGKGNVGLIAAAPKSYKSTIAYDMAVSVASGRNFYGNKVQQGGVAILQLENTDYYTKLMLKRMASDIDELPIYMIKGSGSLDNIQDLVDALPADVTFLIIDPLYFAWGSGDIQNEDSRLKLRAISDAVKPRGIATMLIHHTRKSNDELSTTDIYGSQFLASWYESLIIINRIKGSENTVKISANFRTFAAKHFLFTVNSSGMNILQSYNANETVQPEVSPEMLKQAAARHLGLELIDNELFFKGQRLHV